METFYQVFGFVLALCIGVIILTIFFAVLGYFKRVTRGFEVVKCKGFIKDGKLVNVHLSDGKIHPGLRFIGFSDQSAAKAGIPYQLGQMVVCETAKGARVFFRTDAVRILEEVEDSSS